MNLDASLTICEFVEYDINPIILLMYECIENVTRFIDAHENKDQTLVEKIWNKYFITLVEKCAEKRYQISENKISDILFDLLGEEKLFAYKEQSFKNKIKILENYISSEYSTIDARDDLSNVHSYIMENDFDDF